MAYNKGVDWQNAQESSMSVVTYHKKIETDDSHDEQLMKRVKQVEVQQSESEAMLPDAEFYFNILQDYFESVSHDRLVKSANGLAVVQKTYTNYPDWNHRYTVMENMRSMAKSVLLNNGFEGDSVSDVIEVMMNHCLQVDKQRDLINMQLKEYGNVASEPFQINSSTDNTGFFHEHQPVSFGDAIAASREPLLTYSVRSSSSAYYNSVELQREVETIGSLDHVLAGYEDYKTGDYVFVGKAADVIFRARALGTLQDGDDMTKDSVYTLPMGTDAGHKIFDSLSAKLVNRGYRFGIIGADKVRDLVERPESLDIDVVHPGEREGNVLRLQDRKPRVTSAIQLDLFGSEDFITHEENEHPVAVNVLPGEVVSNIHINDFDPTQLTMRHLDDGEQCYVERRYTENGYFSFVGGDHIESDADVAYIFRSLEDKSVENSFICMVKDGNPTVIHLGIGDATSVMAPIQDALLAYKALEPDKIWFIHNHPSGNLKVSREDYRLQERMEKIFGAACQPGIIINTTSGKFMAYTSSYDLDDAHYIRDGKAGNKAVRTFSFDRNVFEKGWDPFEAFKGSSYRDVAKFVSSHRLGEREKLSLLVMNNNGNITGNIFLPWTNIKDVCSNEGVDLISQTVLQMGGNRCLLYGSEGAILDKELKALNMLQNRLRDYSIALHDVTSVERSLRMEGLLASESMEHSFVRDGSGDQEDPLNTFSRRLSVADREAGGALVDHLLKMGIPVHTDNRENRRILREAYSDHSEIGKVRFFNNDAVESYGFAYKGEIHLDMRKVNAELPLHEYAHLWCEALRRINPDNWRDVVSIMKNDAATWQFVKKSYPELSDDDDLAEEVIAHYSGKRGAEKLQKELERMTPRDANYGSRWGNIFKNVSKAIQDFWKHIGDSFNFKYDSKEDIADQILNDFSKQVNPVKKVERWLVERDKEYAAAVERGDTVKVREMFNAAMQEHVGNGVTPFIAVDGYRGKMDRLARAVKSDGLNSVNLNAINEAADLMSPLVPDNAVLVPAPSHVGYATDMLLLANAIGMRTNSEVADVLKSAPRDSQYDHKINTGKPFTAEELGIHMEGELPEGKFPVVIDNVVNTGNTAEACVKALGGGLVLSLASAVSQERHVSSLKSASPVVYDKQGQLIPLSERFELKNKWLGRIMNYKDIEQIQSALQDQPINVISIGKRMEILTKESVRSIENTRVGYSKMITDGKDAEGCEHLERTIFYDDRPLGDFKADVFPQGQATVSYLLDVRVHPLDMADNAWEGIDDMELDDEYDYGCIRFEDEATMIAFYESHQEEIDYRNGRYNYIEEVATTKGKIAAETLSLNIPVQYLFKPVPPMRDWVDIKTDKSFLNLPQEEQERLLYRKGESVSDYKNRNHLYWGDTDFAFYFWQKYADRQDEVKSILVDGITVDNYQEVSQKIASLVDSKDEGYAIRSLLNYNKLPDQERFYEAFEAAFEHRMINIPEYPVQKQVQGLESYTIDEIKNLVRNHIEDNYGELLMDDGFVIKEITVIGSRSRGEAHDGSDLDILLEYDGNNIREDVMFNILNFEPLEIEGIKVDINPINPHYSLTTEEWLARDARWREEDRKKAIVQPIEKENVESKNIRSMQKSVIKSNLQVLADSLLPDTQSRVHFLKPQDPKLPSAVGGEIYRRDDGIHLFRENKDVPLSSIDDRDEVNDLYRSLLEFSITERIGNGNAMNFPDSPNVDGYKISVAAVVDGNFRVMGTRNGDQANNSSYITNEGLKELIGIIDKRIAEDENIYDNLSVAGSVNGQKENRSDVLSSIEKEVIHSIIRGNGNRADLLEGEEYDRLLHEVHETEISMLELTPLSDRQRDILREISNSFDGGVHEFAKEMNVDVENIYAALDENVLSGKSLGHDFENMYSIKMIDHDRYSVEFDKSIVANLDENYLDYLAINTKGGYNGISDKVARFFSHEAAENYAEAVLVASRPVSAKLRDVLDAVMPNVGDSIPLYMKERTVFDPALFTRFGSVTREGQFDYHVVTNNPDADYHYDSIMCNASDEIIRDLYRQALREELVGKIGVGHAVTDLQALGNSYSGDHSDAYVREGSLLVISGKYFANEKGHPSQYIHDWITCPLDILERTSLELSKRLNIDKEVVNVKENSVGVDSADKSIFHDKPLYHTQEERPYRISYGDDPTGVIEGDIHVHFTKELASLSFDEFEHLAEDMGGSARQMSGERWADFYHENDAEKFAEKVVALNNEHKIENKEQNPADYKTQIMELLPNSGIDFVMNRGSELVIPFSGDKEIQISDIYCKDDIQLSGYIVDYLNQEKVPICPFEELPAPVQLSLFNEVKNTLSDIMAVSNAQEELPYRISYGDDPTGVIEGDIHVHFTEELAYVSFEDFKNFAEDLGGSVRLMNNDRWADFYRENDAVNFANTVVDVNVSRMAAAREGVKEQPKVAKLQDREAFIAEVTEKIHQTENKNYSPEDVVILKEAAIAHIEKYNSDYFQTKDVDIKGMIDASEVTDRHSLLASVAAVVYDIHSEALGREFDILDRLLPIDMDRADETLLQGRDASAAAEAILDLRQNNLKEVLDTKVAEVNTTLAEYNRLSQASDSNYILHSHVESYALEQQSENEFALSDPDQRKFVTSWMGVRDMLNHLAGLMQKMTAKFPELNPSHEDKVEVSSDQKNSVVGQVTTEKSASQKKTSKWDNLDYTKYVLPEGAEIKNKRWKFIKPKEDEQYGKYHIMCDFKGKHYEREMYGNDIKALFEKDEKGQRTNRVTLDQLVAKYFGKQFAEAMSIGSVQEAEHVLAEQKDAKDRAVGTKEQQAQQQADKEEVAAQQKAAEEKKAAEEVARKKAEEEQKAGKKEKVPALILQSTLLIGAFLAAKENDGVWLNKDGKAAPVLHQSGVSAVSAFNGLMMALHSDAHGYKSNDYTTFNAAKGDGYHVMGGESGLPFNWYKWDKYVNRFNANEVIEKAAYDALAPEEKELYKVQRIKEERSIFNIDQTTMPEAKKEAYGFILEAQEKDSVYRGTDESTIQPVSMQKQFVELKEKRPDAILLMRDGNCYNLYGEDADKLSGLLGLEVKDHDPEDNEIKFAAFPHHALDINLPKMIRAGYRVAICDQIGDIRSSQRHDAAAAIYSKAAVLEDALVKLSGDTYKVMKEPFFDTVYDGKEDTLRFTNRRYYSPGNEIVTALQRVNDSFRAAAAYTGGESRLNRVAYSTMLPVDAEKYDRLVSELAAGVLMSRVGLPATLSKESLALVPYWERELKESPKLMESVERDVNNAVEVLEKIKAGEIVDYAAIRGEKAFDAVRPKLYTIANELATIPDAEAKVVVVVKDQQNKSAAVILPAGASLEVNNEIPGLNKNRFLIALRKQGFENVQFYNAGGALGLNQSNDFFADKTVVVAKLKQYDLNVLENIDLSEEIERSLKVDLKQVQVTFDDNMQPLLYVKPVDGESFTVYPDPSDVKLFFDNVRSPEFDTIRENLGQKYYGLVSRHPDLKTDVLMPKVTAGLDLSRISKVNITKDRYKPESTIMFATIDGKQQKPFELSKIEAQRYWLVDDKNKYKLLLAAQHFEEKLNVDSGQSEGGHGQFHNSHKDTVDSTSASSGTSYEGQEDKQDRKVGIRM